MIKTVELNSFYKDSVIVKCDCGYHIAEFYSYELPEGGLSYGIEWHSDTAKRRCRVVDFFFNKKDDLLHMVDFIEDCIDRKVVNSKTFYCSFEDTDYGRLVVGYDNYGYINISRYENKIAKKRDKVVWDLCLRLDPAKSLCEYIREIILK